MAVETFSSRFAAANFAYDLNGGSFWKGIKAFFSKKVEIAEVTPKLDKEIGDLGTKGVILSPAKSVEDFAISHVESPNLPFVKSNGLSRDIEYAGMVSEYSDDLLLESPDFGPSFESEAMKALDSIFNSDPSRDTAQEESWYDVPKKWPVQEEPKYDVPKSLAVQKEEPWYSEPNNKPLSTDLIDVDGNPVYETIESVLNEEKNR